GSAKRGGEEIPGRIRTEDRASPRSRQVARVHQPAEPDGIETAAGRRRRGRSCRARGRSRATRRALRGRNARRPSEQNRYPGTEPTDGARTDHVDPPPRSIAPNSRREAAVIRVISCATPLKKHSLEIACDVDDEVHGASDDLVHMNDEIS